MAKWPLFEWRRPLAARVCADGWSLLVSKDANAINHVIANHVNYRITEWIWPIRLNEVKYLEHSIDPFAQSVWLTSRRCSLWENYDHFDDWIVRYVSNENHQSDDDDYDDDDEDDEDYGSSIFGRLQSHSMLIIASRLSQCWNNLEV